MAGGEPGGELRVGDPPVVDEEVDLPQTRLDRLEGCVVVVEACGVERDRETAAAGAGDLDGEGLEAVDASAAARVRAK